MFKIYLIYIIIITINICDLIKSLYLTDYQIKLINNLIKNKEINVKQRNTINEILFIAYEKFSIKKAIEFKNNYKLKCKNINNDELFLACRFGLFKAIKKYNAKGSFTKYASIYINYELLKLMTERYSINIMPKSYRSKHELYKCKNLFNVRLASSYEDYEKNILFIKDENIIYIINNKNLYQDKMSNLLVNLTDSMKIIFFLKYFSNETKIISNKKISNLMSCSEETIRKQVNKIKNIANKIE
jgi:hypothetical protein